LLDQNASDQQLLFSGSTAVPFVIPSEAEGSAVQRTSLGNVFLSSSAATYLPR
jgi:hypothetical protein